MHVTRGKRKAMKIIPSRFQSILILALSVSLLAACVETEATRPGWESSSGKYRTARYACEDRIRDKIHSDRRKVDRVEFDEVREWRGSGDRVRVQGEGRFHHRKKGWQHFEFNCSYDAYRERITSASYWKTSSPGGYGGRGGYANEQPRDTQESRNACRGAVRNRIRSGHPNARSIHWRDASLKVDPVNGNRTRYSGKGEYVGGKGHRRTFGFRCVYDFIDHRVVKTKVEVR